MSLDNLKDNLSLIISMIVFILFLSVVLIWGYNYLALSDDKLFDDNNKFIDPGLANPDVESNYKDTYKNKKTLDNINTSIMNFFSKAKNVYIIFFLGIFFILLLLRNKKTIIDNVKNMF